MKKLQEKPLEKPKLRETERTLITLEEIRVPSLEELKKMHK
ncbi:MAG: hypothetical protein Q7S21_01490 [archaeon]|nr:hypothetical protein [archaeon]